MQRPKISRSNSGAVPAIHRCPRIIVADFSHTRQRGTKNAGLRYVRLRTERHFACAIAGLPAPLPWKE
jgi:hypothetical protein